ncbi:MAG: sulfite reductase, ferredoxin dependent, partial [Leptolyngbyaceae cyanobacterium SM1_4_3]|nr:sulfite reductase, ferredoxin dependent [Leptolyngbyaceae cyanobacterium SM1_4_3]
FGDFCHRVGFEALRQFAASYQPRTSNKLRHRIGIKDEVYVRLKAIAAEQGKPMTELANVAIESYLKTLN